MHGDLVLTAKLEGSIEDDRFAQLLDSQGQVRVDSDEAFEVLLLVQFVGKNDANAWLSPRFIGTERGGHHFGNWRHHEGFRDVVFQVEGFLVDAQGEGLVLVCSNHVAAGVSVMIRVNLA